MSNEMISESEMTECQFHNNCGGWCETRRELEHNLCEHCLEAHDEEMTVPDSGTISVPRELIQRMIDCAEAYVDIEDADLVELRALLAQPAEQHQAEPVYMVRTHGSCCWEEVGSGSLEDFQSMPEEYELRALYTCPAEQPAPAAVVLPEQWHPIKTCPKHVDVLFYHERNGVIPGRLTDADSLMTDKERDDWDGDDDARFIIDTFGFGHWGVDRMDGSEAPTHWQPLPNPPQQ